MTSKCMTSYTEGEVFDPPPVTEFDARMDTNQLLATYRIHQEHKVRVDITKLTPWAYVRKPQKRVINAIKEDMLVRSLKDSVSLYFRSTLSVAMLRSTSCMRTIRLTLAKRSLWMEIIGYVWNCLLYALYPQFYAAEHILALSPTTEKIRAVQDTIRAGLYAIILHPETPDRALYVLATGVCCILFCTLIMQLRDLRRTRVKWACWHSSSICIRRGTSTPVCLLREEGGSELPKETSLLWRSSNTTTTGRDTARRSR